jgi:hypothetical protein
MLTWSIHNFKSFLKLYFKKTTLIFGNIFKNYFEAIWFDQ